MIICPAADARNELTVVSAAELLCLFLIACRLIDTIQRTFPGQLMYFILALTPMDATAMATLRLSKSFGSWSSGMQLAFEKTAVCLILSQTLQ